MKTLKLIIIILFSISTTLVAQKENKMIRKGNNVYKEGNYKDAEVDYLKALEVKNNSYKAEFNLGDALYEQENYEESALKFKEYADKKTEKDLKSKAYHNLGNSLLKAQKYAESIEAYKNALRNNPDDPDTKYNLEYAKQKLIQQQQNKDNKENKDQNKDQKQDQKNKKDQKKEKKENKDQQNKDEKQQQQKDQQQKNQQKGDKKEQQQPKKISKKDAERMLQALKDNEKETLKKINLKKAKAAGIGKSEKDW